MADSVAVEDPDAWMGDLLPRGDFERHYHRIRAAGTVLAWRKDYPIPTSGDWEIVDWPT